MSSSKPCLAAGQSVAGYYVVRRLGEGGMGEVYEVLDTKLDRRAALKLVPPELAYDKSVVARFRREAKTACQLRHPGVVHIFEYGELAEVGGTPYFVMEYLEGETLASRLRRMVKEPSGRLRRSVLPLLQQLAKAIEFVHQHGLVHRDLKPANVMIVADQELPCGERAKLLDFGIVKQMQSVRHAHGTSFEGGTRSGMLLGTPQYMAPEQWKDRGLIDGKVDVYSFGVIAFTGLGGRLPFIAHDAPALGMLHCYKSAPRLDELDPSLPLPLVEFVAQMLEKDPSKRPTMALVAETLSQFSISPNFVSGVVDPIDVAIAQTLRPCDVNSSTGRQPSPDPPPPPFPDAIDGTEPTDGAGAADECLSSELGSTPSDEATGQPAPQDIRAQEYSEGAFVVGSQHRIKKGVSRGTWVSGAAFLTFVLSLIGTSIWLWPTRSTTHAPVIQTVAAAPAVCQMPPAVTPEIDPLPAPPPNRHERHLRRGSRHASHNFAEKRRCRPVLPTSSCIRTGHVSFDQRMLLLRAFYRSDAKFCPGERLVLSGLPMKPQLTVAPKSMSLRVRPALAEELRTLLDRAPLPSQINIYCEGPKKTHTLRSKK